MSQALTEFGGVERFQAAPERLFEVLTDLDTLSRSVPDLVSAEVVDDRTLNCVVKPGFSFLRGTLKLTISLARVEPPEAAEMQIAVRGIGAAMQISSEMSVSPDEAGSKLEWRGRIDSVSGLLGAIPNGLVKAAADQTIRHGWERVREKLGEAKPADQ